MVSVVIPIYNVAQYLSQCVDSVLSQSYQDLEIILVDDGSTDECPKICDDYQQKDVRIRVVHKENGGLSDARNAGMKKATGEWTLFVDSDDWIDQEAIAKLYQFAIENRCDIVQGNVYYVYADHLLYRQASRKEQKNNVLSCQEAMRELLINDRVKNFAWESCTRQTSSRIWIFLLGNTSKTVFGNTLLLIGLNDTVLWTSRCFTTGNVKIAFRGCLQTGEMICWKGIKSV